MSDTVTVLVDDTWRRFYPTTNFTFSNQGPGEIYVRESSVQPAVQDRGFVYPAEAGGSGIVEATSRFWVRALSGTVSFHYSGFPAVGVGDLKLWLDAADCTTIQESSGFVSRWDDKSGNGGNFAQTIVGQQPSTEVVDINGVNAVGFDTVDDGLISPASAALCGLWTSGGTLILVARSNGNGGNGSGFGEYFIHDSEWDMFKGNGSSQFVLRNSFTEANSQFRSQSIYPTGTPFIMTVTYDGSDVNNVPLFYKDSIVQVSSPPIGIPEGSLIVEPNTFHVGNRPDLAKAVDSDIGEVLAYKRILSSTELDNIHAYLSTKWGISLA